MKPVALTIAGSDSGGGAGIQADLKAFEAHGVFGTSALAAVTAQNTQAVSMSYTLPARLVRAQIDAVAEDFPVAAVKTGMLAAPEVIEAVAERVEAHALAPLVVDPVMVSKSGYKLLQDDAIGTLKEALIPHAALVTPNTTEAALLTGRPTIQTLADAKAAAKAVFDLGPGAVLVKGGHLREALEAVDVLFDGETMHTFTAERIPTDHTHGTGCTYASAIAAGLAHGRPLPEAIVRAKRYVTAAIRHALPLGGGHGPTNHFFHLDPEAAAADDEAAVRHDTATG
jgi:hydroxymethylpyrimidine/phosphomethylpyrimidine kinase